MSITLIPIAHPFYTFKDSEGIYPTGETPNSVQVFGCSLEVPR